jgi:signal transduction histidine kinase
MTAPPKSLDFELLFARSPGLYMVLAPDAPRFTVLASTDQHLAATHTKREQIIGKGLFEVFPENPEDPNATGSSDLRSSLMRTLEFDKPDEMPVLKYDIPKPDGSGFEERYWGTVNSPVHGENGELLYILNRADDVTAFVRASQLGEHERERATQLERKAQVMESEILRRSAELDATNKELRKANERLAELDRAKTAFFTNISHEFRTPLTLLLGPLEDSLADAREPLSPAHHERVELARHNAFRLLTLVNGLLDFSRLEAGKIHATYQSTDLPSLTRDLASVFRAAVEKAGLEFVIDCAAQSEPAHVDREMWEKIVLNLVSNAFKFTLNGRIVVRLTETATHFVLVVEDTGTGIAESELPRVFERFHRVQGAESRTHEGTGIGLSLVHELVTLHEGTIDVKSTLGQGTTFTVSVPKGTAHVPKDAGVDSRPPPALAQARERGFAEAAMRWAGAGPGLVTRTSPDPVESGGRVLLADDNVDIRAYVSRLLSPHYTVEAVGDGVEALDAARLRPPDLVLSDVMMPRLDGFGLLKELRKDTRTRGIPVVLLSARAGEEAGVEGLEAGADDYLVKPFTARELLARVKAHLELSRARRDWSTHLEMANEALVRASQAKSDFLAMMSHELRTPLNAIIGFSEVLIDQKFGALNDRQTRYVRNVYDGGKHLLKLINDLLDLSKIEAGKMEVTCRPCSASALVDEAVTTLQPLASAKNVTLSVETDLALPLPIVVADPVRLRQVLYNLLSNAVKFTGQEGRVTVQFERPDPHFLRIVVADNGAGIAEQELELLFKPFSQLENAKSAPQSGTGLGLALTRQLIELMDGRVGVDSTRGVGSKFYVDIPVDQSEPNRAENSDFVANQASIALVIDDDVASRELLELQLSAIGFRVLQASNGEEGLAMARSHRPDVITLDVFLPTIDGWDVLRALRADPVTTAIPVVLVSISGDRHHAFGLGAVDHLIKPLDRDALVDALKRRNLVSKATTSPVHVLVIDDDLLHLDLVRASLEPLGFRVTVARTGQDGISAALEEPVNLILLDLMLPDISGVEVVQAIRRGELNANVPILLVTGHELSNADRLRLNGDIEAVLAKGALGLQSLVSEIERASKGTAA